MTKRTTIWMATICLTIGWISLHCFQPTAPAADNALAFQASFDKLVKPFLKAHCERCHHVEKSTSGVRVDHLNAALDDRHVKLWDSIRKQISDKVMPPPEEPQPTNEERDRIVGWITQGLDAARLRPTPKNGSVRRLTVAQYRNTLRELLKLEDDLADILPPDAISRDGFVNNQETLALSPLLLESYFEIAGKALDSCIINPTSKPQIQNFRVDLGAGINTEPCPDRLILGADSLLLNNQDFLVKQLVPAKPFPFNPFFMQTKHRFIEGYQGNDTVRGWRDYDSIYHSVFACMRGTKGYPKGNAYNTVPEGLLLRPAIPSAEIFGLESTYGPRANFKMSLRELPDNGRFRVSVNAAKYNDGLLLDPGTATPCGNVTGNAVCKNPATTPQTVMIPNAGIYQVDVHLPDRNNPPVVDASKLENQRVGLWTLNGTSLSSPDRKELAGRLVGNPEYVSSPFGKAIGLDGNGDSVVIPRHESMNVGTGDFTVCAWINPLELRQSGIVCLGKYSWTHGWYLDMPNNRGVLRIETAGPNNQANGTVASQPNAVRAGVWQHVAAVVKRGRGETRIYVNGTVAASGDIGNANLDNRNVDLHLGRIQEAHQFKGMLNNVTIYRRALDVTEIQGLVEPGRSLVPPAIAGKQHELNVSLGNRQFQGMLQKPPYLIVRLPAGPLAVSTRYTGSTQVDKIVFTPLGQENPLAQKFAAFESRSPKMGLHMGLRRDCGSTLSQAGQPQEVTSNDFKTYRFEGAIRNFPSPDVEKDNVNYLAGIREIGVRSEYTDGRDMPRLLVRSVEFEGPFYESWPPQAHRNIFIDFDRKNDPPAYARAIIRSFASRAYRRPISDHEEASLFSVFNKSFAAGASFEQSMKDALQVVLTSPQFLCLIEKSASPASEPIDDYEIASKLSYFLWNSPPDDQLLKLAAEGTLRRSLDSETLRLIDDGRFARFTTEFTPQWLALEKFAVLEPDRKLFPRLTRDVRAQLQQEPVEFVQHLIRNNLPARNLVDSEFAMVNEVVASYYGLSDHVNSGFRFQPVSVEGPARGGVITQAAILAGLSDGRESNPVKRGAWLARRIIGEPPDDPPPNVPTVKEDPRFSLRERLEHHRNQPGCAQCHARIDPWGIPLEEFDAGGRLKSKATDAHSVLPDKTKVSGISDLKRYLANDRIDQVAFSMLRHLATYATGRSLTYSELAYLKREGSKLGKDGYKMRDLICFVIKSPMFLEK